MANRQDAQGLDASAEGIALNFTALFQRSCGKDGSGSLCVPISDVPPQRVLRPQVSLTRTTAGWCGRYVWCRVMRNLSVGWGVLAALCQRGKAASVYVCACVCVCVLVRLTTPS